MSKNKKEDNIKKYFLCDCAGMPRFGLRETWCEYTVSPPPRAGTDTLVRY